MAEKRNSDGGSPFNLNSLLALLTLVGGIWLVSHKLASDRPVTPAAGSDGFVGEQAVEARLWEDPLKQIDQEGAKKEGVALITKLEDLLAQIKARTNPGKSVLLLPVMISGGEYSEDQESRIRSRYAIVSALGSAGFAPNDAEHIGAVEIPWLTTQQNQTAKTSRYTGDKFWGKAGGHADSAEPELLGIKPGTKIQLRYEWYRARKFSPILPLNQNLHTDVLLLWLDDRYFEDAPLLRLSTLLELFTDTTWTNGVFPNVSLIGPRRSSTLRAMLPDWNTHEPPLSAALQPLAQKVLSNVSVYSATASAMDEVLVDSPSSAPRAPVRDLLENKLFKSFHNFTATDLQLAVELLDELRLRNVDLRDDQNHVVLISEWDTFYGRMLSLTYEYEIWRRQTRDPNPTSFFSAYRAYGKVPIPSNTRDAKLPPDPTNLHTFVYLRGLDGQTVGSSSNDKDSSHDRRGNGRAGPTSIEELRHWTPDANKAAGPAQFDYLSRLGDQIHEREKQLKYKNNGRLKAIGIVGSDAYDTLLILQALRPRFPGTIFFTTELDVRFMHPQERDWARNLVVASSYGLTLHPDLQGEVSPFRDSAQTAQFAACLAALGNAKLLDPAGIPPRRFEIGNRTAVDLSVNAAAAESIGPEGKAPNSLSPHPLTYSQRYDEYSLYYKKELGFGLAALAVFLTAACWWCRPLRRLTLQGFAPLYETLEYTEEDIGGPEGAEAILARLKTSTHPDARWLAEHEWIKTIENKLQAAPSAREDNTRNERETILDELVDSLVALLNQRLSSKNLAQNGNDPLPASITKNPEHAHQGRGLSPVRRLIDQRSARRQIDLFLDDLTVPKALQETAGPERGTSELQAAADARKSAGEIFNLRLLRLSCFWVGVIYYGALSAHLVCTIWTDTYQRDSGERLSFISGTSAWPAEIVHLLVFVLSVILSFELYYKMGEGYFAVTRKFRLSFSPPRLETARARGVCAVTLWNEYGRETRFWNCVRRVAILVVLYCGLCLAVVTLSDDSLFYPIRGELVTQYHFIILPAAFIGFLSLAFLTMDAACLCCEFIRKIGASLTRYPEAVRRHFSRLRGKIDQEYLDEWIDLQLIAELTERVGRLAYYPSLLVLLLVVARNSWWDCWSWPVPIIIIFFAHFAIALASVIILQRAALKAKIAAEESLAAKVKKLQAQASPSVAQNNAVQAEQLLDEVRNLQRGAFVPFWKNPVVGAIFLSSGGTTMLQMFIWIIGR